MEHYDENHEVSIDSVKVDYLICMQHLSNPAKTYETREVFAKGAQAAAAMLTALVSEESAKIAKVVIDLQLEDLNR